jgi:hypothetical protein
LLQPFEDPKDGANGDEKHVCKTFSHLLWINPSQIMAVDFYNNISDGIVHYIPDGMLIVFHHKSFHYIIHQLKADSIL